MGRKGAVHNLADQRSLEVDHLLLAQHLKVANFEKTVHVVSPQSVRPLEQPVVVPLERRAAAGFHQIGLQLGPRPTVLPEGLTSLVVPPVVQQLQEPWGKVLPAQGV